MRPRSTFPFFACAGDEDVPRLCEIDGLGSRILFLAMEVPGVPLRAAVVGC